MSHTLETADFQLSCTAILGSNVLYVGTTATRRNGILFIPANFGLSNDKTTWVYPALSRNE